MVKKMTQKPKKAFLLLGLFLVIALVVNVLVLDFFDQKSSYRAAHSLVGILTLMGFVYTFLGSVSSRAKLIVLFFISVIPCYIGTVFPDLDITLLGIGGHRNPIFHSGLLFFILLFLIKRYKSVLLASIISAFGVGLGSHLIWDLFDRADVRWIPGSLLDSFWLGSNGLLCILLARIFLSSRLIEPESEASV